MLTLLIPRVYLAPERPDSSWAPAPHSAPLPVDLPAPLELQRSAEFESVRMDTRAQLSALQSDLGSQMESLLVNMRAFLTPEKVRNFRPLLRSDASFRASIVRLVIASGTVISQDGEREKALDTAIRSMQRTLGVTADGIIGQKTLTAYEKRFATEFQALARADEIAAQSFPVGPSFAGPIDIDAGGVESISQPVLLASSPMPSLEVDVASSKPTLEDLFVGGGKTHAFRRLFTSAVRTLQAEDSALSDQEARDRVSKQLKERYKHASPDERLSFERSVRQAVHIPSQFSRVVSTEELVSLGYSSDTVDGYDLAFVDPTITSARYVAVQLVSLSDSTTTWLYGNPEFTTFLSRVAQEQGRHV